MKRVFTLLVLSLLGSSLWGSSYEEQMQQAEKLFKARKYKDAAAAFDDASLETENTQQRIEARYRSWDSLRKARAANAVSAGESLLYDEEKLSNDRKVELVSYIALRSNTERMKKILEFGLNLKGLNEKQRSKILLTAMNSGGTWQSEAYVNEILAMKDPDPAAKANALGHRANVYLWVKRDPVNALKYVNEALAIKELAAKDRQFYLLVQARSYVALKKFDMAERSYLSAIKTSKQHNFQEAAYNELAKVYIISKQPLKIKPLLKRASTDKRMNKHQRQVFANLLTQIDNAEKQQTNGR